MGRYLCAIHSSPRLSAHAATALSPATPSHSSAWVARCLIRGNEPTVGRRLLGTSWSSRNFTPAPRSSVPPPAHLPRRQKATVLGLMGRGVSHRHSNQWQSKSVFLGYTRS